MAGAGPLQHAADALEPTLALVVTILEIYQKLRVDRPSSRRLANSFELPNPMTRGISAWPKPPSHTPFLPPT